MKRILSCILVLILIFTSVSTTAVLALAAETPTISFNSAEVETGDTVSLQLSINNNPGIAGLAVSLKYDTTALTLTETKKGTLFSGFTAAKNFAWDESEDVTADGILATFTFTVSEAATPGDYDIEVIVRSCTNENLDDVDCNVQNGKITVKVKPVPATGVSLDKDTLSLDTGANNTATLVATVSPDACTNKAVTWQSSDETVATVMNGVVTAIKKGTTTITVTTVDGAFTDECVVTVACAHTAKTPTSAKIANCQEGGWDAYSTCDACGQLFAADGSKIDAIPTTGKNASNHTNIQPFAADTATCTHKGHDAYEKCVDCGVVTSGSDTKFYGDHNYGELKTAIGEVHTPSTLTPAVAAHYQCSVCLKYFTEAKVETTLEALTGTTPSHSYGNWVNTNANQHWKECGCGNKIEIGDHNYDNTCDTTCNTCGHVRAINHTWSNTWSTDGTNHWKECIVCHNARNEEGAHTGGTATCQAKKECSVCHLTYGDYAGCDYVENTVAKYLVSEATCVAEAVYKKSCSVCGTAHATETFKHGTVNANNHVGGTYVEGQRESDCVTPGYTGDIKCQCCRQIVTSGTNLTIGDHVPASVWSNDATHHWKECQTVGCGNLIDKVEHSGGTATCKAKAVCAICGVEYGNVDPTKHVGETEIKCAEPATCDKDGYTGDTWCKDCNTKIKDGEPIPAGHKTTEVPENPASHEAAGNIKYYTCSGCSLLFADAEAKTEIKIDDTVIAKGEHSYGEWVNTDAENHWKECACGNKIETAAHTYGDWTVTKESTTTEKGSKEKNCPICGHKVTEELPLAESTNTNTDTNSPQTGDNSNLALWFVLLMISALGLVSTVVFKKKRAR